MNDPGKTKAAMLNICVRQLQNIAPALSCSAVALLILLFGTIAGSSLCAQDQQPSEQPTTTPSVEKTSRSPTPSNPAVSAPTTAVFSPETTTAAPYLTIEKIRQTLPTLPSKERFEFLRNQRKAALAALEDVYAKWKKLTANLDSLEKQSDIASLRPYPLPPKEQLEKDKKRASDSLTQAKQGLDAAKAKGVSESELQRLQSDISDKQEIVEKIDNYILRLPVEEKRNQDEEAAAKAAAEELRRTRAQIDTLTQSDFPYYERLLGAIDDMANQLLISSDATDSFKLEMSIAFTVLVAIVISGFFWIAFSSEDIKKAIFSPEAGIQFITLFAIVIAVILFGITGILEGKELSALLGGLSGYILGRGSGHVSKTQ